MGFTSHGYYLVDGTTSAPKTSLIILRGGSNVTDKATVSLTPRLITDYEQLRDIWSKQDAVHGNAQSFDWIDCWRRQVNADSFVAGLLLATSPSCYCHWKP